MLESVIVLDVDILGYLCLKREFLGFEGWVFYGGYFRFVGR